jgi:hypothetical protein
VTAVPDWSEPEVIEWGQTEIDAEATAGSVYMHHRQRAETAQARLAAVFAKQATAEFLLIRARA